MSVIQVPGGFGVSFDDFHGHIGALGGVFEGAIIELGVGGGSWTQETAEDAEPLAVDGKLQVDLDHVYEPAKDEGEDESSAK